MADWKSHLNYDYTAYHAYAYGIIYQNGFEPNHSDAAGVANARGDPAGPAPAFYAARSVEAQEESPPLSPEGHARTGPGTGQYHYQGAEIDRLILEEQRRASVDERPQEARLTGSDTASDSDTYISPGTETAAASCCCFKFPAQVTRRALPLATNWGVGFNWFFRFVNRPNCPICTTATRCSSCNPNIFSW